MSETTGSREGPAEAAETEARTAEAAETEALTAEAAAGAQAAEAAAGAARKKKRRGDPTGRLLRVAIALVFAGLVLELVPLLYFRPITFLIFFFFGIPLAGLGMLIYVWRVLRSLRETGAL